MNKSIKRTIAAISMTAMLEAGFALPVSAATQVEVTGNPVMIRADAGLKNTVDTTAPDNEQTVSGKKVQITATPVNVRSGAGTNYKKIGKTSKGKAYTCLASKKDSSGKVWYQIQFTSKTKGWVTGQFAKLTADSQQPAVTARQVQITATPVNVRSGVGTNYKKLGSTSKGKKYTYLASKKDSSGKVWYQIQYTSKTKGWVMGKFAKLVEISATNPVTAYEGNYQSGRATITVKAIGKSDAKFTVTWGSSAWENSVWEFSGTFDTSVFRINYADGVRTDYVYDDDGNVTSKKVAYKNSGGRIQFIDTNTLIWRDEDEQENGEITFTRIS